MRSVVVLALAFSSGGASAAAATNHHVILITVDGMASFYLQDPLLAMPTLRKWAAEGAVAEALHVSSPAVTWPNHTTLVTGVHPEKHQVLFNGILQRPEAGGVVNLDPESTRSNLVAVPTVYDVLHGIGCRTANVNWPCTRDAATLDDNFPDVLNTLAHTTPRLRAELVQAGILADREDATLRHMSAAGHDQVWTDAAVHLIRARRPNFLLFHLLVTDSIQHAYGPQSGAAYTALALADAHLADLLRAVEAAGLRDETTIIVASDHGFAKPTKLINPNAVFRKAGMFRPEPNRRAQALAEGGTAFVYLTAPATRSEDQAKVLELLHGQEGIAEIVVPKDFARLHLPDPTRNPQMCDLLLVAKPGYGFSNDSYDDAAITELKTASGTHGYLASESQMNGILIAWGRGIKRGVKLGVVDNRDVAPTIAALFGQELPSADGKVLREILTNPPPQ